MAQAIILIVSFGYTLIKTNALVSETVQYMMSTSENIKKHKPMGMANNEGNTGEALSIGLSFLISFIILIIIALICYQFWLKRIDMSELERLFKVSIVSFMVLLIGLELVDNMKELWGRVRPYEIEDKAGHLPIGLQLMVIRDIVPSLQVTLATVLSSCSLHFTLKTINKTMDVYHRINL